MAETKAQAKASTKPADDDTAAVAADDKTKKHGTKLTAKDGPIYVTLSNGTHLGTADIEVKEMERDEDGFGVYVVTELRHATGLRTRRMWIPYSNIVSIWQDVPADEPATEEDTAE